MKVASFNFSKLVMEMLLEGKLKALIRKYRSSEKIVTAIYCSRLCRFTRRWEDEQCSIVVFEVLTKDTSKELGKKPKNFLSRLGV